MVRLLSWFFLGLILLGSSSIFAQTPKKEIPLADKQKAKNLSNDGATAFAAKDYEKALKAFQEAYTLNPELKFLPPIAQCLFLLGRYEEASETAEQYLQSAEPNHPRRPEVEKLLGEIRSAVEKQKQEKVMETTARAESAFSASAYEEALGLYQEAYVILPSPALLFAIAQCHEELKHYQEAVRVFELFLEAVTPEDPQREEALHQLSTLREEIANESAAAGQYEEAIAGYIALYKSDSKPSRLLEVARCYQQMGNQAEALSLYKLFLEEAPADDPQRTEAEAFISKMEPASNSSTPTETKTTLTTPIPNESVQPSDKNPSRALFLVAGLAGVAGGAAGVYAEILTRNLNGQGHIDSSSELQPEEFADLTSKRKRTAIGADVMLGMAVLSVGTAIVIHSKSKKTAASIAVSLTPAGAALSFEY